MMIILIRTKTTINKFFYNKAIGQKAKLIVEINNHGFR